MEKLEKNVRRKKRLFIALLLISLFILGFFSQMIVYIAIPGLSNINNYLPIILSWFLGILGAIVIGAIFLMILAILGLPVWNVFQHLAWSITNFLFPIVLFVGRMFKVDQQNIEQSFIEVSNHLVRQKSFRVPGNRMLILTPHCIQLDTCPHKITRDIRNCKQCGQCTVGDLVSLTKKYGVQLAIVTGGTLARQVVKNARPKLIIAVACERDLTSGIQDVFPLPVIGVLNERPYGPCFNTCVDVSKVEDVIKEKIEM